ncbi:imm11 family protein [Archangium sp.]|uniref:imm11 family protein n=1 Tax=Archangium sp. TaxID=1872627 RepID=UPI003899FCE8
MAHYFELMDDRRPQPRWHLGCPLDEQGQEIDPWQFKHGKWLELGCVPRFPLDVPGHSLDYCWAAFAIPVVHERVVRLFERLGVRDVQFIPVQVDGHPGPYFILNALRIIRCIDDARSRRVEYWAPEDEQPEKLGQYRVVSGMRIDPTQVGDARVFRPWGWRVALIISEDLKQAMESEGITGTRFIEV